MRSLVFRSSGLAVFGAVALLMSLASAGTAWGQARCGNGVLEGSEECDNGQGNSDSTPDACRTSCEWAFCGDGITDSDEQCDDGNRMDRTQWPWNDERVPGACRLNCQAPRCGDGVVDFPTGEQCDNGVNDGRNGCFRCQQCHGVFDGQVISEPGAHVTLCAGTHVVSDPGRDGVIRIVADDVVFDCAGAVLRGEGVQSIASEVIPQRPRLTRPGGRTARTAQQPSEQTTSTDQQSVRRVPTGPLARTPGTGIVVTGRNVTVVGCQVENFATGIDFQGPDNVLTGSRMCENSLAIRAVAGNQGARNTCTGPIANWSENGAACSASCN